jgi:hypothetical protein
MATITIEDSQRAGFIGRTGSGKTFLVERLQEKLSRVVVVDSKHRVNWKGYYLTDNARGAFAADKVIYRPKGEVPKWFWEEMMRHLHEQGGGVLYIDELGEVTGPNQIPSGLSTCFRLGRELGVGVWWAAQEATIISNRAINQSDVLCMFLNHGAGDRDKLIRTTGDLGEATAYLNPYEFVVYESGGVPYDPNHIPVYKYQAGTTVVT